MFRNCIHSVLLFILTYLYHCTNDWQWQIWQIIYLVLMRSSLYPKLVLACGCPEDGAFVFLVIKRIHLADTAKPTMRKILLGYSKHSRFLRTYFNVKLFRYLFFVYLLAFSIVALMIWTPWRIIWVTCRWWEKTVQERSARTSSIIQQDTCVWPVLLGRCVTTESDEFSYLLHYCIVTVWNSVTTDLFNRWFRI